MRTPYRPRPTFILPPKRFLVLYTDACTRSLHPSPSPNPTTANISLF